LTRVASLLLAASVAVACASSSPPHHCRAGEQPALMDSLYFGTNMPDGRVSPEDWQRFLAEEITPRFPEGLTSWSAAGQWRNGAGELEKESSFVLHVVHPDTPQTDEAIVEVMNTYKSRFRQEAILRVRSAACISY
jgi:hypothetical protein